jgi:hypothetical protein
MKLDGKLEQINSNVWKLERDGLFYSVKQYDFSAIALKVKTVHDTLRSISFPHIVPVLSNEHQLTFMQPWLEGARSVNFKKRADRTDSLEALMALHETGSIINWPGEPYLHPYPLEAKWEERINRFQNIREECEKYIGKSNFDDIVFYAKNALRLVRKTGLSEQAETLLHGDVVHHNILRDKYGIIRFIDFDLTCTGPPGTEIALWIHRVLPQIDYDIEFLVNEQPALQNLDDSSKTLLLYPNEMLREWLHLFTLPKRSQERQVKNLIPFTESALSHWPKLWYNVERMKN